MIVDKKQKITQRLWQAGTLSFAYNSVFLYIIQGSLWSSELVFWLDYLFLFLYFYILIGGYNYVNQLTGLRLDRSDIQFWRALLSLQMFILLSVTLFIVVVILPKQFFFRLNINPNYQGEFVRLQYMGNGIIAAAYFAIVTAMRLYQALKNMRIQNEMLKRERAQAQYETLKNQISPHFLFNAFNALSSLIYIDEEKATRFVDELSTVFRYVMDNKDKELVSVSTELGFVSSYLYLQEVRFRNNLQVAFAIKPMHLDMAIPPLTLQLLVENAIKHNIVSKADPLFINISSSETDYIEVINNLQLRELHEPSTGIGLRNINRRYGFLTKQKVLIEKTTDSFSVKVPLLNMQSL